MHNDETIFCVNADRPRHPHQEIADLLGVALLQLRDKDSAVNQSTTSDTKVEVVRRTTPTCVDKTVGDAFRD
ncbi:MAG: hypothetical protein JNJ60_18145 [Rhodocyclaceae bacterium]|nr:hypothetical protein [Rhodocyclaceae bacterium]